MKPEFKVITSMLIWGSLGLFVSAIPFTAPVIAFLRAVIGFLVLSVAGHFVKEKSGREELKAAMPVMLSVGGIMGLNWAALFSAYKFCGVSVATLCYYMAPVITIVLCTVLLKERLTGRKIFGIAIAVAGMVLVNGTGSGGGTNPALGIGLALMAAVIYACVVTVNKASLRISRVTPMESTTYELLGAAISSGIYALLSESFEAVNPGLKGALAMALLGVVHTGLAYIFYFGSIPKLPGHTLAVLSYFDPVSALFFSAIFLSERMNLLQWTGALLVLGGAAISQLQRRKKDAGA